MLPTGFSALPLMRACDRIERNDIYLLLVAATMAGVTAGGPVGPGLADIGDHRGDLLVVQFILPGGHLAQVALAAIEDGGDHRLGVTQDKRVFIQGREGGREPLAIGAMALGAIVLKDFLALLDERRRLTLGPGARHPAERQAQPESGPGSFILSPWLAPGKLSGRQHGSGSRRDL